MEENMVMSENPDPAAASAANTPNVPASSKKKPSNLVFIPVILLFVAGLYLIAKDLLPKSTVVQNDKSGVDTTIATDQNRKEDTIYFVQPFQDLQVGEETQVEIGLNTSKEINGFEFSVVFDPEVLEIDLSTTELGPYLGSTGRTANILGPIVKEIPGKIKVGGFSYGDQPSATGDGVVVILTARALQSGSAVLAIEDSIVVGRSDDPYPTFSTAEAQINVN